MKPLRFWKIAAITLGLATGIACATDATAERTFNVHVQVKKNGNEVASPDLVVVNGKDVEMTVASDAAGSGGRDFKLHLRVDAVGADRFDLSARFMEHDGNDWALRMDPTLSGQFGKPLAITLAGEGEARYEMAARVEEVGAK